MRAITILLFLCLCVAGAGATEVQMPPDIKVLSKAYSSCLAEAYDDRVAYGARENIVQKAKEKCQHERKNILHSFPLKDRAYVNHQIEILEESGFRARKMQKERLATQKGG